MAQFDVVTARLVLALARDGSIARAAERESIAPSAVSRRIADLEARLGVSLFDRTPQGVRLTDAGQAYADGCRAILRQVEDLDVVMADHATGRRGSLRLASTSSALSGRLPELLALFAREQPTVSLQIQEMTAAAALSVLEDARADVAIVADYYDFAAFAVEPFEADRVWVIAPPGHPLAARIAEGGEIPFAEATVHEVVGVRQTGALDRLINEAARKLGRSLGERVRVDSFPALVRMVEAGFGIGFLRRTSLHLLAGTDLVAAPLGDAWAQRRLLIATRKDAPLAAPLRRFLELCRETRDPELDREAP
ncbi:LysR family transcriptional regulator [Arenibaculum pallidiluteum]|uniref:LysR family transcriptional regulator n=1 Tax=Arenibaculum pallidiluteum TaxID=2812559 RepID=UPI001A9709E7|nr:LysR family transcriptional regulator [Arenibaculum pallidiluteum]